MNDVMNISDFWNAILRQDANAIREQFHPDAWVNWHNTNEHFTVAEFIRANCECPGEWDGEVDQIVTTNDHNLIYEYWKNKRQIGGSGI